jgi:hypothetical protein
MASSCRRRFNVKRLLTFARPTSAKRKYASHSNIFPRREVGFKLHPEFTGAGFVWVKENITLRSTQIGKLSNSGDIIGNKIRSKPMGGMVAGDATSFLILRRLGFRTFLMRGFR